MDTDIVPSEVVGFCASVHDKAKKTRTPQSMGVAPVESSSGVELVAISPSTHGQNDDVYG